MKLSALKESLEQMDNGHRFEVIEGSGIFATVTRRTTKANKTKMGIVFIEYMKKNGVKDFEDLTDEQIVEASKIHFVKNIIKDVEGLEDENGEEIQWSEDVGLSIINDEELSELMNRIIDKSMKDENFFDGFSKKKSSK